MGFFEDMYKMKLDAQRQDYEAQISVISDFFNELTEDVNKLFELLEKIIEPDFSYFTDFKMHEAFNELDEKYRQFWEAANRARDNHKQSGDWAQFREVISEQLHPLALDYTTSAGRFGSNAVNVGIFCSTWPVVEDAMEQNVAHLDFDYEEFTEIDFDPNILYGLKDTAEKSYFAMSELGGILIQEWTPFGDYEDKGWNSEFKLQLGIFEKTSTDIEKFSNHARSLFRKLWEIKKQVQLTQEATTAQPVEDAVSRIEKLGGLLNKGLITQVEYDKKKAKLLEEI